MPSAQSTFSGLGAVLLALSPLVAAVPNGTCLPLVRDEELQASITLDNLYEHAEALQAIAYASPGRNRVAGSIGHNDTIDYIVEQLEALGDYYSIEVQPWNGQIQQSGEMSLFIDGVEYESQVVEFSSNASVADAPLVAVADLGCFIEDYPATVAGSIALIHRGSCPFSQKAALAAEAGALAIVLWNNEPGIIAATYGGFDESYAPGGSISQADGEDLVALLSNTTLTASIDITTIIEFVDSANVIATSKYGDPDNILFLGAHSDSVSDGPGINDDGSGVVGILETAIQLAKWRTNAKIQFGWWTAEEAGLLGSTYYVSTLTEEELLRIRLYLNFDMIASPNYILGHYDGDGSEFGIEGPPGSAEVEHFFEAYYESLGLNHTATQFNGRSDYAGFMDAGVPSGGLDAGADEVKTPEWVDMFGGTAGIILDPNYHSAADDVSNLNATAWEIMSRGIAHAVAVYGRNAFEGFPPRETSEKRSIDVVATPKRTVERLQSQRFPVTI
ncbi:hypothetical protein S40293_01704 [Stachybotrys chartarum IBT 40293]|nr:hypothetical protein S40293_01704 [Stachybotrys chartarum IBT 40293]